MDVEKFARLWDWAGNWAMVVLQPGEIPATAEPGPFFESMVNFESVAGSSAAAPAWRAAALKWPNEPQPYLALGNQLYASGDLDQATVLYRQGLKLDGNDVALANNLASVLGELGCPQQGEELLLPVAAALTEDSGWYKIVSSTLAELSALTSTADSKSMKECANRTQQ
jgi:predicted Zn-dependent protease